MYNNLYEDFIRAFAKMNVVAHNYNYKSCAEAIKETSKAGHITFKRAQRGIELNHSFNDIKHNTGCPVITLDDIEFINELTSELEKYIEVKDLTKGEIIMHNNLYEDFIRAFAKMNVVAHNYNYKSCAEAIKETSKAGHITFKRAQRGIELSHSFNAIKHNAGCPVITLDDIEFINELTSELEKYIEVKDLTKGGRK